MEEFIKLMKDEDVQQQVRKSWPEADDYMYIYMTDD